MADKKTKQYHQGQLSYSSNSPRSTPYMFLHDNNMYGVFIILCVSSHIHFANNAPFITFVPFLPSLHHAARRHHAQATTLNPWL